MTRVLSICTAVILTAAASPADAPDYKKCHPTMLVGSMSVHAARGDSVMVDWFLKAGVPADGFSSSPAGCALGVEFSLPLIAASGGGHLAVARLLLRAGANPNSIEGAGDTPLTEAVRTNNLEMASLLLENGANPHEPRGNSAIERARRAKNETMVQLLTRAALAPNQPLHPTTSGGLTAAVVAGERRRYTAE